jgi:hypothetical protein
MYANIKNSRKYLTYNAIIIFPVIPPRLARLPQGQPTNLLVIAASV